MGKIIFRNAEETLIRNFGWLIHVHPDGRMSRPMKFDGLLVVGTGKGQERRLELIHDTAKPYQLRLCGDIGLGGVALGALGMWFVMVAMAFFP